MMTRVDGMPNLTPIAQPRGKNTLSPASFAMDPYGFHVGTWPNEVGSDRPAGKHTMPSTFLLRNSSI